MSFVFTYTQLRIRRSECLVAHTSNFLLATDTYAWTGKYMLSPKKRD